MFKKKPKKKTPPPPGTYRSETAPREPGGGHVHTPQLVVGEPAPPVPPFGGEGLHANTVYEVRRRSPSPEARVKAPTNLAPAPAAPAQASGSSPVPPKKTGNPFAKMAGAVAGGVTAVGKGAVAGVSAAGHGAVDGVTAAGKGAAAGVGAVGGAAMDAASTAAGAVASPSKLTAALLNVHEREDVAAARGLRAADPRAPSKLGPHPIKDTGAIKIELPRRPGIVIPAAALLYAWLGLAAAAAAAIFTKLGAPVKSPLLWGGLPGLAVGAAAAFFYHRSRERQRLLLDVLNLVPGRKGLYGVLGSVPPWVSFQEREKAEWLNKLLSELWPYYDKAIAKAVKEAVEPIMNQYKPPGLIKRISFKTLTFGDAPFRIENVWVEDEGEDHVLMEVAFRWAGEANIAIAIDLPAGGDYTRMVPKVTDLRVAGVARVTLSPLVDAIPGFGAAMVALRRPPLMHFNLDFGAAFGGSYTARAIRLWLDPFIRTTLTSMVVWPNRIVVPMMPESITGPLDHLYLRHQGLLVIDVLQADGLRPTDRNGKADPFVEVTGGPGDTQKTRVVHKSLAPVWNETKYVLIQEPKTQALKVEVYDHDMINVKELLQVNVIKGARDVLGARTLIGRVGVPIRDLVPGETADAWFPLGLGEFGADDGTGSGEGRVRLRLTWWPWETLYSARRTAGTGAVLLTLRRASDLPRTAAGVDPAPYARVSVGGDERATRVAPRSVEPAWSTKFEWRTVAADDTLELTIWDSGLLGGTCLGMVEVDIAREVAGADTQPVLRTWFLEEVPPDAGTGQVPPASVTLQIQWVPYDFDHDGGQGSGLTLEPAAQA